MSSSILAALIAVGFGGVAVKLIDQWFKTRAAAGDRASSLAERVGDESAEMRRELRADVTRLGKQLVEAQAALAACEQRCLALASEHERLKFQHGVLLTQVNERPPPKDTKGAT